MQVGTQGRPMESVEPMKVANELLMHCFSTPSNKRGLFFYQGSFYQWYGDRWQVRDDIWLEDMCWQLLEDAHYRTTTNNGIQTVQRFCPNKSKIENVVRAIMAQVKITHTTVPCWLGPEKRLNPERVVTFENVLIDPKTKEVIDRDEEWFDPVTIPCNYDPDATCPRWEQCIDEWSDGCPVWKELLQRWMGYCLMPHRKYARWLLMYGKVRAGKGTISHIIEALIGTGNYMGTSLDDLAGDFGLDGLEKSRVLCISEVSELDSRQGEKATRVLKNIVGRDPIAINIKFQRQMRNVLINSAPMVQANEIPKLPNKGRGLSSKMLVLPFDVTFEGREDFDLMEVLMGELPGIAKWALEGASKLENESDSRKRFPMPDRAQDSIKLYHIQNNPFDHFLEERFIRNPKGFVATEMVWNHWVDWLETNGVRGVHVPRNQIALQIETQSSWNVSRYRPSADSKRGLRGMSLRRTFENLM